MNACPETAQLRDLLDERSEPDALRALVLHIEGCPACQGRLEGLTDRRDLLHGLMEGEDAPGLFVVSPLATTNFSSPESPPAAAPLDTTKTDSLQTIDQPGRRGAGADETRGKGRNAEAPAGPEFPEGVGEGPGKPMVRGYDVGPVLGQGGMGVVYRARHRRLNRLVALKMIRDAHLARPEQLARFRSEAEAVARLQHPNIVQVYDVDEANGLPVVALELLEGGSLGDHLGGTPMPARQAAGLVALLARAVESAHAAGIVHRDLKPANILYTADGVPKITDFGLAKHLKTDEGQTRTGQIMGTPSYMAPEQASGQGRAIGPATDVYALGAILYELLTGRPPFNGETSIETVRQVVEDEVVPPSRLVPKLSRDLETICLVCLNKEPARRFASASALADDLERYSNGEPILARRTGPLERFVKWTRRRPAAATLLVLSVAASVALITGAVLYVGELRFRDRRALELIQRGNLLIDRARTMTTPEDLSEAKAALGQFLVGLDRFPRTGDLEARVKASLDEVDGWLQRVLTDATRREREIADRQRYQTFQRLRIRAHLGAAAFALDPTDRMAGLRETARSALAVYVLDPKAPDDAWELSGTLPDSLQEADRREIVESCYDLLLMLSQTLDGAEGLRVLDRAARLRPEPTAAYHLRRAECLADAGDAAGRRHEEELAGRLAPRMALDYFLMGRERLASRRWDEAISALETAAGLDPDLVAARALLAVAHFNARPKRLGEALGDLNEGIRRAPDLVELHILRALVHGERGNEALLAIDPEFPEGERALREQAARAFDAAENDYRAAIELHPGDDLSYVLLVNRAGLYLQAGRFAESLADLEAAIALKPAPYQAYAHLAQLLQQQGKIEEAARAFGEAIERTTEPTVLLDLRRSRARMFANRPDVTREGRAMALGDLDEAIRLDRGHPQQVADDEAERARLLFGAGQFAESLDACADAIRLVPDHPSAHRLRISSLMALRRYDEVLSSCDAYLSRGEPSVEILEIRGLARVKRRDYSGAIADYTHALELRPGPSLAARTRLLNHRGWAHHFADAPRLALADFSTSLGLNPDQSDAMAGRGLALVRLGQWRPAVLDAEAAVRLAGRATGATADGPGTRRQAHYNAARIYAQATLFASAEAQSGGEGAVDLDRRYFIRGVVLLRQALDGTPEADRPALLDDPALQPLRVGLSPVGSRGRPASLRFPR